MQIYNTLTRQKQELQPATPGQPLQMYVCGPTVYNYIHIGNARPFCLFDTLRRYLEYRGTPVRMVQNFTDVDDKIIRRAAEEQCTLQEITERFIAEFWVDAKGLNIAPATVHPKATESMPDIIAMVATLLQKGHAYEADGDVYFSTRSFAGYGKLSHQPLADLEAGARIMVGEKKREPMDFALWKASKAGEPAWDSPWGKGRPGWHIECSAMAKRHLGASIDLHCGGMDLIFPHHENEIAQSECANDAPFARFWMHNGFITIDNEKMSKSRGNFFTVREVAEVYGYEPIRYLLIASHYRTPINYSVQSITQSVAALQRLYTCREKLEFALQSAPDAPPDAALTPRLQQHKTNFLAAMDDDFNTADALGCLFRLVRDINTAVLDANASAGALRLCLELLNELSGVLGLLYNQPTATASDAKARAEALLQQRQAARQAKNWAESDALRDEIATLGFRIEDTPQGALLRPTR